MSESSWAESAQEALETRSYDPTSVVGDHLMNGVARYGTVWAPAVDEASESLRITAAVVTFAAFSGNSEVAVAMRDGTGRTTELSVRWEETDTPTELARRIDRGRAGSPATTAIAGDLRCQISLDTEASARAPQELSLAVGAGRIRVDYAMHLYEPATAQQIADYLATVLAAVSDTAGRLIADTVRPSWANALAWLTPHEADPEPEELLRPGDAVAHWTAATPSAVAIDTADGITLTYAELGAAAGALATRLRGRPAGPVAVLTEDALTAVTAMVACQLADRCHIMLDPTVSVTRNAALVVGGGGCVIVYDTATRDAVPALAAEAEVPALEYRPELAAGRPAGPSRSGRPADDGAAYIAFTSGTTGLPKGVVQPRRSFAQFLAWQQRELSLGPGSRVAMWSAPVFDACYMEVFGALAYGATLCIPPAGQRRDPVVVAEWLAASRVTFFQGVPSFVEHLVAALEAHPRPLPHLADVIVAGEVLPPALCGRMRAVFGRTRVRNMFGPTECVLATRHHIAPDHPVYRRVPIGRPITGRRIVLMDEQGRPVPRGAVGEIGVASRFLSTGYAGDQAQTAARYRPLPGAPEYRIYHTGDFGRIGPDGELRFLGRRDAQVKVRGIRINLDEIEAVLSRHEDVRRCKVIDVRVPAGHVQLVAFVEMVPARADSVSPSLADAGSAAVWRHCIGDALGARIVPARFLVVPRLPQTVTGKPDLNRMRQWDAEMRGARGAGAAPPPGLAAEPIDVIRQAVHQALGHPVADTDDLLAGSAQPLLAAVRVKKALQRALPEAFATVDIRAHRSVGALAEVASAFRRRVEGPPNR